MIKAIHNDKYLFAGLSALFVIVAGVAVYKDIYLLAAAPFLLLLLYAGWQHKEIVFLLLLVSLPFSAEYSFSSSLGTDIPDEPLMLLTTFCFFAYWVYKPATLSGKYYQHPLLIIMCMLLLWTMITVIFSTDKIVSLKYLLAKGWYLGAFILAPLIIFQQKRWFISAVATLTAAMLIVTLISLYRHFVLGFSFAGINEALSPFFRNHVNYSAMLVCFVPVLIAMYQLVKKNNLRLLVAGSILVVLTALFFSYARGAWLALAAGLFTYWLIQKKLAVFTFMAAIMLALFSLFWLKSNDRYLLYAHDYKTTIFHENFKEHLVATYKLKDVSTAERFYRWIAGVRMIKDKWITGYGPNNFYANYKPYAVPAYKTWVSDNKDRSTVHNYFLLTVIEQGIPGLVLLLLLVAALFYYAQYLYHRVRDKFYRLTAITIGAILSMLMVVNFLSDLLETDKAGSLFFLCIAGLIVTDVATRKELSDPASDI